MATLTLRRGREIALVPGTQVSFQVPLLLPYLPRSIYSAQEGHWGFFLLPPWPGVGEVAVALRGSTARGSPYTVRVLALKLDEEGDGAEVRLNALSRIYLIFIMFIILYLNLCPLPRIFLIFRISIILVFEYFIPCSLFPGN